MKFRAPNQNENTVNVMVRVSPAFKKQIEDHAVIMGVSSAEFIRRAVHDTIDKMDAKDPICDRVFDLLDDPLYIAKLKEKLNQE